MSVDGYIRVSRVAGREGESFISPDVQRATIERLAATKGMELGEVVQELDVSGGVAIDQRELGRLVRKVEAGESDGIIVWKVSRFSRDQLDCITVARRIADAGGVLIGDDLDTSAPMGRAMLGFLSGWAEEERDHRRASWDEARRRAVARGATVSPTPVGYIRGTGGRLAPDPRDGAVRRRGVQPACGRRVVAGSGGLSDGRGRATAREEREAWSERWWGRSRGVMAVIRNEVYRGASVSGEYRNDQAHEPIVAADEWRAAQRSGRRTTSRTSGDSPTSRLLLKGLARCADCGHLLAFTATGPKEARRPVYYCRTHYAEGTCTSPAVAQGSTLDRHVEDVVVNALKKERTPAAVASFATAERTQVAAEAERAARAELEAFLATGLAAALGPERFRHEVERRQRHRRRGRRCRSPGTRGDGRPDAHARRHRRRVAGRSGRKALRPHAGSRVGSARREGGSEAEALAADRGARRDRLDICN